MMRRAAFYIESFWVTPYRPEGTFRGGRLSESASDRRRLAGLDEADRPIDNTELPFGMSSRILMCRGQKTGR